MATTATALRLSSGAVVVPSYREHDMIHDVAAIVAKVAPDEPEHDDLGIDVSEEEIEAAVDVADALRDSYMPQVSENDSKIERASKEASKRAKAEILAKTLKAFFLLCDADPHAEGEHE